MVIYRIKLGSFLHTFKTEGTGWDIWNTAWCVRSNTYNTAVLFAFVWGGHNSQILDDLLSVLCLPSTRLSTRVEKKEGIKRRRDSETEQEKISSTVRCTFHSSLTQFNWIEIMCSREIIAPTSDRKHNVMVEPDILILIFSNPNNKYSKFPHISGKRLTSSAERF